MPKNVVVYDWIEIKDSLFDSLGISEEKEFDKFWRAPKFESQSMMSFWGLWNYINVERVFCDSICETNFPDIIQTLENLSDGGPFAWTACLIPPIHSLHEKLGVDNIWIQYP